MNKQKEKKGLWEGRNSPIYSNRTGWLGWTEPNAILAEKVSRATIKRFRHFFGGQFIIWPFRRPNWSWILNPTRAEFGRVASLPPCRNVGFRDSELLLSSLATSTTCSHEMDAYSRTLFRIIVLGMPTGIKTPRGKITCKFRRGLMLSPHSNGGLR